MYVTNQKDDSVIVVNANVCNGSDQAGCATLDPPEIHTGADPEILTLDPDTQTLYTANQVDNDVSVIDATRCDAQTTSGCRARVAEAPIGSEPSVTADPPVAHRLRREQRKHGVDDRRRASATPSTRPGAPRRRRA